MRARLLPLDKCPTSRWSGGVTRELLIWPLQATYRDRDFLFRLSVATLENAVSTYTRLPGVRRKLMLLKGRLELHHDGGEPHVLDPFQQLSFLGEWNTTCAGTGCDFNLMLRETARGEIAPLFLAAGEQMHLPLCPDMDEQRFLLIYPQLGAVMLNCSAFTGRLETGAVFLAQLDHGNTLDDLTVINDSSAPFCGAMATVEL